jgi:hypothetical protein
MKVTLSRTADVLEHGLVREILYRLGYGARRDGDHLVVYNEQASSSLYVGKASAEETGNKPVARIYCDEGWQQDCLTSDGKVGINRPWMEMCSMNEVLKLIVLRLDPEREYERSPYMGRGFTARHYHAQYVKAIDELSGDNEMFTLNFEWPSPIIIPEIGEDSPASRVG